MLVTIICTHISKIKMNWLKQFRTITLFYENVTLSFSVYFGFYLPPLRVVREFSTVPLQIIFHCFIVFF